MTRLPVSGLEVVVRPPDGSDELALREAPAEPTARAIALVTRLAGPGDWGALTVCDFDTLLAAVRIARLGESMELGLTCPACGERVELGFHLSDFMRIAAPRTPAGVEAEPGRPGWFRLGAVRFRLPTAADQAEVAGAPDPERALAALCLDPPRPPARARARVERAMAAMAPEVSRPIAGTCPHCAAAVHAPVPLSRIVVAELLRESAAVYEEIDLIARAYHWPEADILALPSQRRRAYAERIRLADRLAA